MTDHALTDSMLRKFFTHSLEMLCIAGDGYLFAVNPAWEESLGWSSGDLTSRPFLAFVHPDDAGLVAEYMNELSKPGVRVSFQARFEHRTSDYATLHWSCFSDGQHVYGVARDVTEFVEARSRAERNEALAVGVLRTAVDPIIVMDSTGTMVDANEATGLLFGFALTELVGQNVSMLMPEPYSSQHDGYLARYLAGGDPRIIGIGREVEAQRADGSTFPISLSVSEVKSAEDHMFTGIIHDLTERNRQRSELRESNERLEQRVADRTRELESLLAEVARSNRDLEQFAYIASHDLQAPLRNVRQGLELLDEHLAETLGESFDAEARELRSLVVGAVLQMEELIKGLLAYARLQRFGADEITVDLHVVLAEVLAGLSLDLDEADATVTVGELPAVSGDALQLHQLFQNLLQNAIRYRSGDRKLTIEIESEPVEPNGHLIKVRDNGIGVASAHHDRIFELFRRGHSGYEGVGLGLAICQRITERHGGRIWVESIEGKGATFCVTLSSG